MNEQAMIHPWRSRTRLKRSIIWYIPAVLMFASLCLQIAAQSGQTTSHQFVVASRTGSTGLE